MLETLGAVASAIFIIGLIVFGISIAAYIFSGDYEIVLFNNIITSPV